MEPDSLKETNISSTNRVLKNYTVQLSVLCNTFDVQVQAYGHEPTQAIINGAKEKLINFIHHNSLINSIKEEEQ